MSPGATPRLLGQAPGECQAIGVTRDGLRLVLVTRDLVLHVLEAGTGRAIRTLPALPAAPDRNGVGRLTLTAEDCAVVEADDISVAVWDIRSGALRRDSQELGRNLVRLTVSSDGRRCIFNTLEDDRLWVWDLVGGGPPASWAGLPFRFAPWP